MKAGDIAKIVKPTFLYNGVFILQNSEVEVLEVSADEVKVLYRDREGMQHELPLKAGDLSQ